MKLLVNYSLLLAFFLLQTIFISTLYVKWTRYPIPTLPWLIISASLLISRLFSQTQNFPLFLKRATVVFITFIFLWHTLQGIFFSTIYYQPDPRISAAQWVTSKIGPQTRVLSEVWDLGIVPFNNQFMANITLFNFYELDHPGLKFKRIKELKSQLSRADVIIILSRRIWKHSLDNSQEFPEAAEFYQKLFSKKLGFVKIADFYNQPRFGPFSFDSEKHAEETFSVFDHPHVQIWQKTTSPVNIQQKAN